MNDLTLDYRVQDGDMDEFIPRLWQFAISPLLENGRCSGSRARYIHRYTADRISASTLQHHYVEHRYSPLLSPSGAPSAHPEREAALFLCSVVHGDNGSGDGAFRLDGAYCAAWHDDLQQLATSEERPVSRLSTRDELHRQLCQTHRNLYQANIHNKYGRLVSSVHRAKKLRIPKWHIRPIGTQRAIAHGKWHNNAL
jgi:hypothetical protein